MTTKNNKEIIKENIEEAIIKNTVHIDGRMTLTGTDFNRLVKDLLSLIPEQGEVVAEFKPISGKTKLLDIAARVDSVTKEIYYHLDCGHKFQIIIKQKHNDKGDW